MTLGSLSRRSPWFAALAALALFAGAAGSALADDPAPGSPPKDAPAAPPPSDPNKPGDPPADKPAGMDGSTEEKPKVELPKAPAFTLKDLDGKDRTLAEFAGKWVVLEWTNYGCPFVKKHYAPGAMQALQKKYGDKGVVWLSICSSAQGKQGWMTPEDWKKSIAAQKAVPTAVLLDGDGTAGHAYGARTTPDMRIIDPKGGLVYQGAIDDNPDMKSDPSKARNYVSEVLDAVLDGKAAPISSTKPYGCSVKYAN